MEIYELKYFLAAAATENLHQAAENIHISPASISKAISRLEEECQTNFFLRVGRGIKLTEDGQAFAKGAADIVAASDNLIGAMQGRETSIQVELAGSEFLLSYFGSVIVEHVRKLFPNSRFRFNSQSPERALTLLNEQRAHLVLATEKKAGFRAIKLAQSQFETVLSDQHPSKRAWIKKGKSVPVTDVQNQPFASTTSGLLGQMSGQQSSDGWRDDKFPRKIDFICSNLSSLLQLVKNGNALAYLPDFVAADHGFHKIKVAGCPYTCEKSIYLLSHTNPAHRWVDEIVKGLKT